ncbi:MAG: AhpC/TSA family protein, partial [Phaeodactylibacter sp.]|nr:AhpC/TSA family protein [Phaeodactylibacter sp.]
QPEEELKNMITNTGANILDLSMDAPVLLVFLRHFGCIFCREALSDISNQKQYLEDKGTKIVFVHMSDIELAERYFSRYELSGVEHISDPDCRLYRTFGLAKGSFTQLFGLSVWMRGFQAGVVKGHGIGNQLGDGFQMPGVFVIQSGQIKDQYIHKLSSDRPDYRQLVDCCSV